MRAWQATVQDERGNAVFNPIVTVYEEDGVTLASIYNENGTPKENPFTGTTEGFAQFWADRGTYRVVGADGNTISESWQVDLADEDALQMAAAATRHNNTTGNVFTAWTPLHNGNSGTTAQRPTDPLMAETYYDTTLGLPILWNGTAWTDFAGNAV